MPTAWGYHAEVTQQWPWHFSLINVNVSDEYGELEHGYLECDVSALRTVSLRTTALPPEHLGVRN